MGEKKNSATFFFFPFIPLASYSMEIKVDNNPQEWKNPKLGDLNLRIGGADVGVVCGIGYPKEETCNPNSVYLKKRAKIEGKDISSHEKDPRTEHGDRCEPIIAQTYAAITGNRVTNANYWLSKEYPDLYGAKPDRKVYRKNNSNNAEEGEGEEGEEVYNDDDFIGLLEIKAPYVKMYTEPKPEHIAQMMYEMWIIGKPWCDYCAQLIRHEDSKEEEGDFVGEIMLKRVHYNEKYVAWMLERLLYMSECIMKESNPNLTFYNVPPPEVRIEDLIGDLDFPEYEPEPEDKKNIIDLCDD